ncbi:MAG: hypothetical protein B6I18_02610 [Bacteroidetes bacterium 4572_112]|nr:MAG: hypothetical protein B6I18_02610 [Bacteroidetes bacterium 4572_112]
MRRSKSKKKLKLKNWLIIIILSVILLLAFGYIFKRPIIYYSKILYHIIIPSEQYEAVASSNTKTNLYSKVQVPSGEVYGIDISRYQGVINWKVLSAFEFKYHKIDFMYIKATESTDWVDKRYKLNWKNAHKYGYIRGAYHFFDPDVDSKSQMDNFFSKVTLKKGDLPPMLDVEKESKITTSEYRKKVMECLQMMEVHYGMRPMLYTHQSFYDSYFAANEFSGYSLWISRLKQSKPKQKNWVIWQFSHHAVVPGIDEYVDFNVFNGSLNDFKILQKK